VKNLRTSIGPTEIMVVEDDELFLRVIAKCLTAHGFRVHKASSAESAKIVFDANSDHISLIISDVRMPTEDGVSLKEYIRNISDVPFLLMTGFPEELESLANSNQSSSVLAKPFETETLISYIVHALANMQILTSTGSI
jgi:DNA-binding NtrC family response regulator